ncbi:hypothetical protein GN958_ATG08566 [Phytophthora infestans]|uniref:Uncharacterized protein n=1 Tax=Phytophthora infestans TaxID=4787 RepID=A0A8S9UNV6_PHYIN|nr:hypothetical protein GN958_ATG08566 [Phytophthora infestans]
MCAAREKRRAERIVDGASSIETRWKFIPPGGKANGIEGKDYFLGEDRVCAHYVSILVYVSSFNGSSRSAELAPTPSSTEVAELTTPVGPSVEELQATSQDTTESTTAGRSGPPPRLSASSSPVNGMYSQRVYLDCPTYCVSEDEYELVPRDRVVSSSPAAHTSIGTSLFGSSDEDDSDDEVAIDEVEVVIVDDDNGDSDYEDGASCCTLYIQPTLTLSNM